MNCIVIIPNAKLVGQMFPKSFCDLKLLVYIITTILYTNEVQHTRCQYLLSVLWIHPFLLNIVPLCKLPICHPLEHLAHINVMAMLLCYPITHITCYKCIINVPRLVNQSNGQWKSGNMFKHRLNAYSPQVGASACLTCDPYFFLSLSPNGYRDW
jgi:hypothetical protein